MKSQVNHSLLKAILISFIVGIIATSIVFLYVRKEEKVYIENPLNVELQNRYELIVKEIDSLQEVSAKQSLVYAKINQERQKYKEEVKRLKKQRYETIQAIDTLTPNELYNFCSTIRQRGYRQ